MREGFPKDDEHSIQAGCCGNFTCDCTANLDIFYSHQYVQSEENANYGSGISCKHALEHTPVLPKTVIGTIYYNQVPLCTFHDKDDGSLLLSWLNTKEQHPEIDFPELVSGEINYTTGIVTLTWDRKIDAGKSRLVICYEYNLECQRTPPKQIECPKCNHKFYDVPACDDAFTLQQLANGDGNLDLY